MHGPTYVSMKECLHCDGRRAHAQQVLQLTEMSALVAVVMLAVMR
jgi:hypothetical protein